MFNGSSTRTEGNVESMRKSTTYGDVTAVIINFNGLQILKPTLDALKTLEHELAGIVVVDDGSDDGSPDWVKTFYPQMRVLMMGRNTKLVNAVRNRGLCECTSRYVLLMDNDIVVTRECIDELLRVMQSNDEVICCTPRLLQGNQPERLNYDGQAIHFLGMSAASAKGMRVEERRLTEPFATSGCPVMLIDRKRAAELGFLDEGYSFGWGSDAEFHFRARLQGFQCLHVPTATCSHFARVHSLGGAFGQVYNRYRFLITMYSGKTLLLLAPAFLFFELGLTGYALLRGFACQRFRALTQVIRERRELLELRAKIQSTRVVRDRDLIQAGNLELPDIATSWFETTASRVVSKALDGYWRLVCRFI
jgi:GT2 family glycosyltransferase